VLYIGSGNSVGGAFVYSCRRVSGWDSNPPREGYYTSF
jgi:hypothetical protein